MRWRIRIDRGGTFTDCIGLGPAGEVRVAKVLSSDDAPIAGIRALLHLGADDPIPPCDVRMGTTIATNALLERRGAPTALAITRGFGDLLAIGDQTRADLFALDIVKPAPLPAIVVEIDARAAADGTVLADGAASAAFEAARAAGATSLAISVLHAYAAPELEARLAALARAAGFAHVTTSTEVAHEIGFLARTETAVVDAYLTPLLTAYVDRLQRALPGSRVLMMQSSGGLVEASRFRGRDALISGPAGGAVAVASIVRNRGPGIGFDMGGTSTDVTFVDGAPEVRYESIVAGVRVKAPMLAVHTVAAGGGSLCRFDGLRLTVGPASAGADPGPLCYGRPSATEPTLTDVDLILGRIAGDLFPFPLDSSRPRAALAALGAHLPGSGDPALRAAAAFFAIGNATMAEAIRRVTISRGRDPRSSTLVVFGGAAGMHACAIARALGVRRLIVHPYAGVLSAWGMGLAETTWHGQHDAGRVPFTDTTTLEPHFAALEARGRAALAADGHLDVVARRRVDLRYQGSDASLTVPLAGILTTTNAFTTAHHATFGYTRNAPLELTTLRIELATVDVDADVDVVGDGDGDGDLGSTTPPPPPRRHSPMWTGTSLDSVPVYHRADLPRGLAPLRGPALILDTTSTLALDPDFTLSIAHDGSLLVHDISIPSTSTSTSTNTSTRIDPTQLEVLSNLYMSIAEQMGDSLRRTAVSTNIRERLDFSCALFDSTGGLVANAPHIPVHLGAMGETIRSLLASLPDSTPPRGTVYASNDPAAGGSHLPDITVITPIHDPHPPHRLLFFTACRGHHADVGGITPGSMPPFSRSLADEGAVFHHVPIVVADTLDEPTIRATLSRGGARRPDDNVADLAAQVAANRAGADLLLAARARHGDDALAYMPHVQTQAAALVSREIARLPDGDHAFADTLDDGTPIRVTIRVRADRMTVDFTGTAPAHAGNLNAPRAVTVAAVLYVLRALVGAPIPLNAGCLAPVELIIPLDSLLDPPPGVAVCGGNVETSQRVVDVLLGALRLAAASQGTMNNLTFGTDLGSVPIGSVTRAGSDLGSVPIGSVTRAGSANVAYYETICGGAGATPHAPGADAVHTHMTNTRITDPEILESRFPIRLRRFAIRRGSGGAGLHRGGDGVIRELELLSPLRVSLVSQRRTTSPFGLDGGAPGAPGRNALDDADLGGAASVDAPAGAVLRIETPGGGGFGPLR